MNYDRNGVLATQSRPKPVLRKCYRVVTVDSRDRDPTKYVKVNGGALSSDPGDYVVYLPRPFQKVTRIRLMNAAMLGVTPSDTYILMQLEGLNRIDETASGADRSGYVDSAFAKILNDRPVVATGAAYTYSTITSVTNRTFTTPTATATGTTLIVSTATGTFVTYTGATGTATVGSTVVVSGFTGNYAPFNGTYQIVTSASGTFTVLSSAQTTSTLPSTAQGAITGVILATAAYPTGNGSQITYTFTGTHNISIGETITVSNVNGFAAANMTGVVTSVPSSSTLTLASTSVGTGTSYTSGGLVTVNNLQYTYQTSITTSFVTGQYLVISGLINSVAYPSIANGNVATQILQSSISTGTSGTFETANIQNITASGLSGTAIISQAIYYNDMSYAPNITYYNPPIGTLDRLHITLRRHLPLSSVTTTNPVNAPITFGPAENTFTFEIEYIDNVFEDVSTFETRLDNADYNPKYQV
jgi:hypothetical protein